MAELKTKIYKSFYISNSNNISTGNDINDYCPFRCVVKIFYTALKLFYSQDAFQKHFSIQMFYRQEGKMAKLKWILAHFKCTSKPVFLHLGFSWRESSWLFNTNRSSPKLFFLFSSYYRDFSSCCSSPTFTRNWPHSPSSPVGETPGPSPWDGKENRRQFLLVPISQTEWCL